MLSLAIKMKIDNCTVKTEHSACEEPYQPSSAYARVLLDNQKHHSVCMQPLLFGLNDQQVSLLTIGVQASHPFPGQVPSGKKQIEYSR